MERINTSSSALGDLHDSVVMGVVDTDTALHELKRLGKDSDTARRLVKEWTTKALKSSTMSDILEDEGLSQHQPDDDFDAVSLVTGIAVELEHTDDVDAAKEIAKDHLVEDPEYYDGAEWKEDVVKHLDLLPYDQADEELQETIVESANLLKYGSAHAVALASSKYYQYDMDDDGMDEALRRVCASGADISEYNGCNVTGMSGGVMAGMDCYDTVAGILGDDGADALIQTALISGAPEQTDILETDDTLTLDEIATIHDALAADPMVMQIQQNRQLCRGIRCRHILGLTSSIHVGGKLPRLVTVNYEAHGGDMSSILRGGTDVQALFTEGGKSTELTAYPLGDGLYEVESIDDGLGLFRPGLDDEVEEDTTPLITADEISMVLTKIALSNVNSSWIASSVLPASTSVVADKLKVRGVPSKDIVKIVKALEALPAMAPGEDRLAARDAVMKLGYGRQEAMQIVKTAWDD